jgi:hypothetical protein
MAVTETNFFPRNNYTGNVLDATVGVLKDNSTREVSAEDLRQVLWDLANGAAFRKTDPYVRYVIPSSVGGTADSITITLTNDYPAAYTNAIPIRFQAQLASTGDVSINVNSIGSVGLYKENQSRVSAGDLVALSFYECVFNSDADGAGTDGFTLYEGIGGTASNPTITEITGTTATIASTGSYVFTGASDCAVTLTTTGFSAGQSFKLFNTSTANCTVTASTGTIKMTNPFVVYAGTSYEFVYTGISSHEWVTK